MLEEVDYGAELSECRTYRYVLWRIWDNSKPKIMFIGLNPSTADENTDDNTITRTVAKINLNYIVLIILLELITMNILSNMQTYQRKSLRLGEMMEVF